MGERRLGGSARPVASHSQVGLSPNLQIGWLDSGSAPPGNPSCAVGWSCRMANRNRRMTSLKLVLSLLLVLLGGTSTALAQQNQTPPPRVEATRLELEAIAAHPPKGMSQADLAAVQRRLTNGDFAVGDKIQIQVNGEATLTNTFTVAINQQLLLPALPPLPLAGVLRSESDSVITEFIGRYIRGPQVTVEPLMRLGVLGGVAKPGYYDLPSTSLLSEVVMQAGGMAASGKMEKTQVLRGNSPVLDPKAVNMGFSWYQEPSGKIWWTLVTGN